MEKIGMIGIGAMGLALLERLKLTGTDVVCYDAYAPALEQGLLPSAPCRLGACYSRRDRPLTS